MGAGAARALWRASEKEKGRRDPARRPWRRILERRLEQPQDRLFRLLGDAKRDRAQLLAGLQRQQVGGFFV